MAVPGSLQLLKLSKEDSIEIFGTYPEEFDIICGNLLAKYDLDLKGQLMSGSGEEGAEVRPLGCYVPLRHVRY
eukprot:1484488-Rhodomonas_salina.1